MNNRLEVTISRWKCHKRLFVVRCDRSFVTIYICVYRLCIRHMMSSASRHAGCNINYSKECAKNICCWDQRTRPAFFAMLSRDKALCACARRSSAAHGRARGMPCLCGDVTRCILLSLIAIECEDITMVDASACCTLVLLLLKDLIAGMPTPWFVYILQYVNTVIFNVLEMTMAIIY